MDSLIIENLEIVLTESESNIILDWKGKCDVQNSYEILGHYFETLHDEIDIDRELVLRFTDLEYFNSSSISSLVKLLRKMDTKGVKVLVLYNKDKAWQCITFRSLETFALIMKNINVIAE